MNENPQDDLPMKPTGGELTLLVLMQIGLSMAASLVARMMQLPLDVSAGISGVAIFYGAHFFVQQMSKHNPQRMQHALSAPLATAAAVVHILIGIAFLLVTPLPPELQDGNVLVTTIIITMPIAGAIVYGITLWGLRIGMRKYGQVE